MILCVAHRQAVQRRTGRWAQRARCKRRLIGARCVRRELLAGRRIINTTGVEARVQVRLFGFHDYLAFLIGDQFGQAVLRVRKTEKLVRVVAGAEQLILAHDVVVARVEHFAALGTLETLQVKDHAGRFAYVGIPFDRLLTSVTGEK